MDLFSYLPIVVAIRTDDFSHLHTTKTITETDPLNIHIKLLSKLHDDNFSAAAIFENEIYVTRQLHDISNNDMKTFLLTNTDWDMLIVSDYPETTSTPIEGLTLVAKAQDTTFRHDKVYLASSRMMLKAKNNDLTNLQIYKYTSPFIEHVNYVGKSNNYTVCRVTGINLLDTSDVKYKWIEMNIK